MWAQVSSAFIRPVTVRSAILRRKALSFEIGFFDGVHVGAVRGQISQLGSRRLNELLDPWSLVARQIVHDDDVAFRERGNETFFHPFLEGCRIHRLIESLLGHEAGKAQTGDQRDGLVMAVGNADAQPSPSPAASAFARQICGSAGLIDENEPSRIEVELRPKPLLALLQYVRALLLLGMRGLFLKVISWRSKKRQITDEEKRSPQLAIRRSWISNSVMSGCRRMRPSR